MMLQLALASRSNSPSVRRLQPIADAGLGQNVFWARGVRLDFVSQLPDIDAQILRVNARGPKLLEQELMGQYLARVLNQEAQKVVLLGRKLHALAANLNDAPHQVDRSVAKPENRALALHLKLMAERRADAGEQLLHAERLGDIIIGALIECRDLGNFIAAT